MSSPPFFPCYAEDAMSGILESMMTPEQVGCYFMLLCMEWTEQGPLSATSEDDWRRLAVRTRLGHPLVHRLVSEVVAHGKYDSRTASFAMCACRTRSRSMSARCALAMPL